MNNRRFHRASQPRALLPYVLVLMPTMATIPRAELVARCSNNNAVPETGPYGVRSITEVIKAGIKGQP